MLARRIIPCLDVTQGRVVKGLRFHDLRDAGDPVELARFYDAAGADELVFLDISATKDKTQLMVDLIERLSHEVFIPLIIGGGIDSAAMIGPILRAGADKVSINSAALRTPEIIDEASAKYGSQCIVLAIDAKRTSDDDDDESANGWRVHSHGGSKPTDRDPVQWAKEAVARGAGEILLTSMDRDGTKLGFDLELTTAVTDAVSVPVIASGGAGDCNHFVTLFQQTTATAGLAASIFHFKETSIRRVKRKCLDAGLPLRPPPRKEEDSRDRDRRRNSDIIEPPASHA